MHALGGAAAQTLRRAHSLCGQIKAQPGQLWGYAGDRARDGLDGWRAHNGAVHMSDLTHRLHGQYSGTACEEELCTASAPALEGPFLRGW